MENNFVEKRLKNKERRAKRKGSLPVNGIVSTSAMTRAACKPKSIKKFCSEGASFIHFFSIFFLWPDDDFLDVSNLVPVLACLPLASPH